MWCDDGDAVGGVDVVHGVHGVDVGVNVAIIAFVVVAVMHCGVTVIGVVVAVDVVVIGHDRVVVVGAAAGVVVVVAVGGGGCCWRWCVWR